MTYVTTSKKEMAETIKWHPREKINCLITTTLMRHASFQWRVIFLYVHLIIHHFLRAFLYFKALP